MKPMLPLSLRLPRRLFLTACAAAAFLPSAAFATGKEAYAHYMKAILLQHQGDYAQALSEYEAAARLDPRSTFVREQAAQLALGTGHADQALVWARELVGMDPRRPESRLLLGNILWARGKPEEARKAFEEALRLNPGYADALFALGTLLNTQSPEKARKYFERCLEAGTEHAAEAHYQIALIDERRGRHASAVEHLKTSVKIDPGFVQGGYALAHLYEMRRDTEAALGEYARILSIEPENVALVDHIGELYAAKGDLVQAKSYFSHARALAPHDPQACLWLALLAEQAGDYAGAAAALSGSSALQEDVESNLRLSFYLTQAGQTKDAVAALERAHARWPQHNGIAYFLALGYDDIKQSGKAADVLREILKRNPDFRDARFQLGAIYEKIGRMDDAEREFRALLDKHPDDAAALNYLGYSLADRGMKLDDAEKLIREAVRLAPGNGAYRDSLGWVEFKRGRYPQALEDLREALRLLPEDSTVWEHAGDVHRALGEGTPAWRAWKMALLYDPSNAKLGKKIEEAEKASSPAAMGANLMDHLERVQGGVKRYSGVCEVIGSIGGKEFAFRGMLAFRSPEDVSLEVLGPLLAPVFRAHLGRDGAFEMDAVSLPGIPQEAARETLSEGLRAVRDYLSGAIFRATPALYHKGWRTEWVATPGRRLFLDDARVRLKSFQEEGSGLSVALDDFRSEDGRQVPAYLRLDARKFSMTFKVPSPLVQFSRSPSAP